MSISGVVWGFCGAFVAWLAINYLPLLHTHVWGWYMIWSLRRELLRVMRIENKEKRDAAFDKWIARMQRCSDEAVSEIKRLSR